MDVFFRFVDKLVRAFCFWLAKRLPQRIISRDDGAPYLERYYLCGEAGGLKYFPEGQRSMRWWQKALTWLPCVYLHRFVASDSDVELHNHPWTATALILSGGYIEERRGVRFDECGNEHYRIDTKTCLPWSFNRLGADTYHRVLLIGGDCWTVIKIGEKVQTWGFWHPETHEFVHWKEHWARKQTAAKLTANAEYGKPSARDWARNTGRSS